MFQNQLMYFMLPTSFKKDNQIISIDAGKAFDKYI